MTPAQNQIQDELQRKHEELQQLIMHQQEELRKVSEQLLKYGILSLNVSLINLFNLFNNYKFNKFKLIIS